MREQPGSPTGQRDATAVGSRVEPGPDVDGECLCEAGEHGEVHSADQLGVFAGELVEGAVAKPDDAVVVVGFEALVGQAPDEIVGVVAVVVVVAGVRCGEFSAAVRGGLVEGAAGGARGVGLDGTGEQLSEQPVVARRQTDGELAVGAFVVLGGTTRARTAPSRGGSRWRPG